MKRYLHILEAPAFSNSYAVSPNFIKLLNVFHPLVINVYRISLYMPQQARRTLKAYAKVKSSGKTVQIASLARTFAVWIRCLSAYQIVHVNMCEHINMLLIWHVRWAPFSLARLVLNFECTIYRLGTWATFGSINKFASFQRQLLKIVSLSLPFQNQSYVSGRIYSLEDICSSIFVHF